MTHKKGDKFIGKCWLCGSVCNCEILKNGYERARAMSVKTCENCKYKTDLRCRYCFESINRQSLPEKNEGLQIAERLGVPLPEK